MGRILDRSGNTLSLEQSEAECSSATPSELDDLTRPPSGPAGLQPELARISRPAKHGREENCESCEAERHSCYANACPLEPRPCPGAERGTAGSAKEIADHVDGGNPIPQRGGNGVDASLIGDLARLHAGIHKEDTGHQPEQRVIGKQHDEKRKRDQTQSCTVDDPRFKSI